MNQSWQYNQTNNNELIVWYHAERSSCAKGAPVATVKIPADNRYFKYVNANPAGKRTGDCIMRAVSAAAGVSWEDAVRGVCRIAIDKHIAPQDPAAERELLKRLGFAQYKQPKKANGKKLTGREFCTWLDGQLREDALPTGARVVANIGTHHVVAVIRDETGHFRVHDTWDCTTRCVGSWWVIA